MLRTASLQSDELLQYFFKEDFSVVDLIKFHLQNPALRVLTCQDCMFYSNHNVKLIREGLIPLIQMFVINVVNFNGQTFEFTCHWAPQYMSKV